MFVVLLTFIFMCICVALFSMYIPVCVRAFRHVAEGILLIIDVIIVFKLHACFCLKLTIEILGYRT